MGAAAGAGRGFLAALQVAGAAGGAPGGRGGAGGPTAPRPLLRAETGASVGAWRPPLGELTPPGSPSWEPRTAALGPAVLWAVEPRPGGRVALRNVGSGGLVLRAGPRGHVVLEPSPGDEPFALWAPEGAEGLSSRGAREVTLRNVGDPSQSLELVAHGVEGVLAATLGELSEVLKGGRGRSSPWASDPTPPEGEETVAEVEERCARKLRHVRGLHAQAEARVCLLEGEAEDLKEDLARKGAALGRAECRSRALALEVEELRRALEDAERQPAATGSAAGEGAPEFAFVGTPSSAEGRVTRPAVSQALPPLTPGGLGAAPGHASQGDDKENLAEVVPEVGNPAASEIFVYEDPPNEDDFDLEQPISERPGAAEAATSSAQSAGRRQPRTLSPYLEQREALRERRGGDSGPLMSRAGKEEVMRTAAALKHQKAKAAAIHHTSREEEAWSAKKPGPELPLTPEMAVSGAAPVTPPLGGVPPAPPPPPQVVQGQLISRCEPVPSRGAVAETTTGNARDALLSAITRGRAEGFKLKSALDVEPALTPVSRKGQKPRSFHSELKRGIAIRRASMPSDSPGDLDEW